MQVNEEKAALESRLSSEQEYLDNQLQKKVCCWVCQWMCPAHHQAASIHVIMIMFSRSVQSYMEAQGASCMPFCSLDPQLLPAAHSLNQCQRAVQRFLSCTHPCCAKAAAGF